MTAFTCETFTPSPLRTYLRRRIPGTPCQMEAVKARVMPNPVVQINGLTWDDQIDPGPRSPATALS